MRYTLLIVLATVLGDLRAQDVYFAVIKTEGGRTFIMGFLYQVGDSTLEIIPGRNKKDIARMSTREPLSVPIHVIKEVALRRVRSTGRVIFESTLMATASALFSVVVTRKNPKLWPVVYFGTYLAVLLTYMKIVVKTYEPTDLFFREKLEDRCIVKDKRSIVSN